ncbi:MAG: phospho-sugar mutase [Chloroflexi bacterium]|nr:phospho-sugar mutase [Chloroflexota bacterium]MBV9893095.1 phospho-sugar mutase [Chloroflexota bacterium]
MTTVAADLLASLKQQGRLSSEALHNVQLWLEDPSLAEFTPEIQSLAERGEWGELEDAFYKHINIGTGGIRGAIGPGPNRINTRTIGEAAQALCQFIDARGAAAREGGVVVGHEARLGSSDFARVCSEVFAANGIRSFRFDGVRSTPEISFAVRYLHATAGVQITASHNPKSDNGFKFYWSYGGQVVPPLDGEFMELVTQVRDIHRLPLEAGGERWVTQLGPEVDEAYLEAVGSLSVDNSRSAKIVFGAIHGAGKTNVLPVLERAGFSVQPVPEQLEPDSSFPTAAGKLINPEYREVCERPIQMAERVGADLAFCSDPDADRAAVAARTTGNAQALELLRGDDVGAALTHFVLNKRKQLGLGSPSDLVLETYVTTSLVADIARRFGVECIDDLNVGFKWMAQIIQQREDAGRIGYFFATEESIGYLAGNFVRDKDASIAALLVAEMASALKDRGQTIWGYLDEIYAEYGCYRNVQHLVELPGKTGMQVMREVMLGLRRSPPETLGGKKVLNVIDRLAPEKSARAAYAIGSGDDMVTFVLSDDQRNRVTARPSGTEPKLKYYIQLFEPVPASTPVPSVRQPLSTRALDLAREIVDLSGNVIGTDLPAAEQSQVAAWRQEWLSGVRRIV